MRRGIIPAGTYEGQDEDVQTATVINYLVTHEDVSEETAYQMTKLLFENLDRMVSLAFGRIGHRAGKRGRRESGAAAPGRRALLPRTGPDPVRIALSR